MRTVDTDLGEAPELSSPDEEVEGREGAVRVVGVGASAGGLDALIQMFREMPEDVGLAFVVVQHLSPDHPSMMPELLARHTKLQCKHINDGEEPIANCIYLLPPKNHVEIEQGQLRLVSQSQGRNPSFAVDHFFRTLAKAMGDRAIAVILSGSGSDGTQGVRAVNEEGGLVLVQDPESAAFDGMPRSASNTGVADFVVPAERLPSTLLSIVNHTFVRASSEDGDAIYSKVLDEIFSTLERRGGIDFSDYKPATTMRRIERRMVAVGARDLREYLDIVRENAAEISHLQRDLLIGVTKFFRDPKLFRKVEMDAVSRIFERSGFDGTVRIWSAGCSTGEEAYTLAILVSEYMESKGIEADVKVFATDVDRRALERASMGLYPEGIAADVSPDRLERYFIREEGGFRVVSDLRNMLVFAPQNLLTDPPFTRIDLISCRNVLIYLEPPTQRRLLEMFHFALRPGGFLFLGSSETIGELSGGFLPVDTRAKLFRRGEARSHAPDTNWRADIPGVRLAPSKRGSGYDRDRAVMLARFHSALVERFAPTAVLVDRVGHVLQSTGQPERFLRIGSGPVSLEIGRLARPGLAPVVVTALQRATRDREEVRFERVEVDDGNGERTPLELRVIPLVQSGDASVEYLLVSFRPLDRVRGGESAEALNRDDYVAALETELRHNRDNLSATIEELETANEELQATNEELLAANEELQSTNEELQATNEELHTVNGEYQRKIKELEELNADIDNFFRTANVGTLFLDHKLRIRRFTPAATQVISLIKQDVGRPLGDLSDRIGGGALAGAAQRIIEGEEEVDLEAQVDDRSLIVQVRPYMPESEGERGVVVTFVDVTENARLRAHHQDVLDKMPNEVAVVGSEGKIELANAAFRKAFPAEPGTRFADALKETSDVEGDLQGLLTGDSARLVHHFERGGRKVELHGLPLSKGRGAVLSLLQSES